MATSLNISIFVSRELDPSDFDTQVKGVTTESLESDILILAPTAEVQNFSSEQPIVGLNCHEASFSCSYQYCVVERGIFLGANIGTGNSSIHFGVFRAAWSISRYGREQRREGQFR